MADRYWMDALKIRRRNWGLVPAPLPYGAPTGRGADKTTRDFLICFGLEDSPATFRRRALGHLASYETASGPVVFSNRSRTTLRVSLRLLNSDGTEEVYYNQYQESDNGSLDGILRAAQRELIEQEIFTALIRGAGNLPTTTARVSERLIVIEIAQGTELYLELVESDTLPSPSQPAVHSIGQTKCDMIYHLLHILLLRLHSHIKERRLSTSNGPQVDPASAPVSPTVLQPVIDILQYETFCQRVKAEMGKIVSALTKAGVPIKFEFNAVGETGEEIVRLICEDGASHIGGETTIRIDNSRTLRFTFHSPSSLIAHISQATLSISSITQLVQLLRDETEKCLLQRICDVGNQATEQLNGVWFVDLLVSRSIGKWEGCVINFRISYDSDSTISCTVSRLIRSEKHSKTYMDTFTSGKIALFDWIRQLIQKTIVS
ncbi:hypothetical protein EVG20_g9851 [Dentipellis fragilis]|uniref:Mediator of RNA polymerase II transcription subunit 17 n=1 Tax=Dentipellis fragilis TaxID=205917 RepID=A0A4Y9XV02_9AGAM|nr:hypothetical protein EVG20_g9851 [Dentipellis fragilis]